MGGGDVERTNERAEPLRRMWTHHPYSLISTMTFVPLHARLSGHLRYCPFPCEFPSHLRYRTPEPGRTVQVAFVGQLPFDMDVTWLLWIIENATLPPRTAPCIYGFKKHFHQNGKYNGCVRLTSDDAGLLAAVLDHRVLIEESGIWIADTVEQKAHLAKYCAWFEKVARASEDFVHTPYMCVTCEWSRSQKILDFES